MSDWIKILFMVGGMAVTMYVVQKEQSFRLNTLERQFDQHLELHQRDLDELKKDISQIRVNIARLTALSEARSAAKSAVSE